MPMRISEAQKLIREIYGERDRKRGIVKTALHLGEELGELFHALRTNNVDNLREELSSKIDTVGAKLDTKIDDVDARLSSRIDANGVKIDNLRGELLSKIDTNFKWTLGIMIPMWVTIILSILAILFK